MSRIFLLLGLALIVFGATVSSQQQSQMNAAQLFEQGVFLETVNRDLPGAIQVYEAVLAVAPHEADLAARAYYRLGECLRRQGKYRLAQQMYKKMIELFPEQKVLVDKARARLKEKNDEDTGNRTRDILQKTITADFSDAPVMDVLTWLSKKSQLNMAWTVSCAKWDYKVNIKVKNLRIASFLNLVLKMHTGDHGVFYDAVVVGTAEEIAGFRAQGHGNENLPVWAQKMEQQLAESTVSVEFIEAPFRGFVDFMLRKQSNIALHPTCNNDVVNLRLFQASAQDALRLACMLTDNRYLYKNQTLLFLAAAEYNRITQKKKQGLRQLIFEISHDVAPPAQYPEPRVTFVDEKTGIVRFVSSGKRIQPDTYLLAIKQPGYETLKKRVVIAPASQPYVVREKIVALPRNLSFDLLDSQSGEMVSAHKILVNGKMVTFNDTFKPGSELHVEIHFADYETVEKKLIVVPGKGPFVISVALERKN